MGARQDTDLDANRPDRLRVATVDPDVASRTLLSVLGITPPTGTSLDVWTLTELVAMSADREGSIVSSISSLDTCTDERFFSLRP